MKTTTKKSSITTTNIYMEIIKFNKSELMLALQPVLVVDRNVSSNFVKFL